MVAGGHPRTYGGTGLAGQMKVPDTGTSPHLRGNRTLWTLGCLIMRDIPAPTGEPSSINGRMVRSRGHPRTYGGTLLGSMLRDGGWGTSPHLRGNRVGGPDEGARYGDIPAPTGEPYFVDAWLPDHEGHPRTYGGTQNLDDGDYTVVGTSPHLRGNRWYQPVESPFDGDIPAPAGEPPDKKLCLITGKGHPRTYGGTRA